MENNSATSNDQSAFVQGDSIARKIDDDVAFGLFQYGFNDTQNHGGLNLRNCVFLDNESTVNSFCNKDLVTKIFPMNDTLSLVTNGGVIKTHMQCEVKGLDQPTWYHPEFITNVLSLGLLKKKYRITYDSAVDSAFIVHRPGRKNMRFECTPGGLHYLEVNPSEEVSLVETVQDNSCGFSSSQIKDAKVSRELMAKLSYPSEKDMKEMIQSGFLMNFPVTVSDIEIAN